MRRFLPAVLLALLVAAPAHAADPGRWRETGLNQLPITYYQGVTHDSARNWHFDGIYTGLWRTDTQFNQTAGVADVIPDDVAQREGYNHIGDLTFDPAEGGRLLLPLECYDPIRGNTCGTGSFGVADPATLAWRYYVKLDPAEIPKAMWAEVSPDGQLVWTSSGNDLLAYRTSDISLANAAPGAAPIKAVQRLKGAVPPSGITGASFYKGRLFVAGSEGNTYEVFSIDLTNGSRRLEIERTIVGESEGLDTFDAAGGTLHWLIQPFNLSGQPPTYGPNHATLLHFQPAPAPVAGAKKGKRLKLVVKPRAVRVDVHASFKATVTKGKGKTVKGALITLAGHRARTNKHGVAVLKFVMRSPGTYSARATRRGLRAGTAKVTAVGQHKSASKRAATPHLPAG
jgi:hypothetical protein